MEAIDLNIYRDSKAAYAAEQCVIAGCVEMPERLQSVSLEPKQFTEGPNRRIWEALLALHAEGEVVDVITVMERLEEAGYREETTYLRDLMTETLTVNFDAMVAMVWRHSQRSEFWAQIERALHRRDEAEIVRVGEEIQMRRAEGSRRPTLAPVDVAFQSMMDEWAAEREMARLTWGIGKLDRNVGPLRPTRLYIVGARPRMGKTAMAVHLALANALQGRRVGFLSVEQSMEELTARMLCNLSQRPMEWVQGDSPSADRDAIDRAKSRLRELPITICDQTPMTIGQCMGWGRTLVQRYGAEVLIVDYVQKLKGPGNERRQEVENVVTGLKDMARQLKVPVVALAQMNRDAEGRRPTMADLKESGTIEQEADVILALHREEEKDTGELSPIVELIVTKNRHGRGDLRGEAFYRGECFRFEEVEGRYAK